MPELHNRTPGQVELVPLIDRFGSNVVAVICKVTYVISDGAYMQLAPEQEPITFADVTAGDELVTASDITDIKLATDVVVTKPATAVEEHPDRGEKVEIRIGSLRFGGAIESPWPFGPISRAKAPRVDYVGTYDGAWLAERFPLLPADFDPRHNQVAPASQIANPPLIGDEAIAIRGLYGRGQPLQALFPGRAVVVAGNIRGHYFTDIAMLDTVTLSSERPTLTLVWRLALKPRQKVEEVRNVFVSTAFIRSTREILRPAVTLRLAITGVGLQTPVGLTGLVALHSVRSGISRLARQPVPDRGGEWVVGSVVPRWIAPLRDRRLSVLATDSIRAALDRAGVNLAEPSVAATTALILGGAEGFRPGYGFPPRGPRFRNLIAGTDVESIATIEVISAGACSAQRSLARAAELFESAAARRCVLGAADNQVQLRVVRWHEDNFRLKCSYLTDGLMPGEAAAFIVVEPEAWALERGAPILARILSVSTAAREAATVLSDQPNTASGLTHVVRQVLADANVNPVNVGMAWTDLNGESYRAREWAFTEVRLGFTSDTALMHPADCHGDLGAATDANLLGLAALAHATGWSDGRPSLVFSGSEGGLRAATVLAPSADVGPYLQVSQRLPRVLSSEFQIPPPADSGASFRRSDDPPRAHFEWQLHEEHRDEIASLYYQRNAILREGLVGWSRLRDPEQRILNHLDAAVASGPGSMAVIAAGVDADEEGICFAGAFLIGTLPSRKNFARIGAALEEPKPPRVSGIGNGLVHAPASEALDEFLRTTLDVESPAVRAMAVSVASARRFDIRAWLPKLLTVADAQVVIAAAEACRRIPIESAGDGLKALLEHERSEVRRSAALALLRIAPAQTLSYARSHIGLDRMFDGALSACLGIGGQPQDLERLLEHVDGTPMARNAIAAIGTLGWPAGVPRLLELLEAEDDLVKVAAAEALALISGSRARERATITVVSDAEVESREVERIQTASAVWRSWWDAARQRLDTNVRWRRGGYFTIGSCIDELADPESSLNARSRVWLEMTIRARIEIPFEADWFVARQDAAINDWRSWWVEHPRS